MIYGDRTKEHRNQHGRDGKDIKKSPRRLGGLIKINRDG